MIQVTVPNFFYFDEISKLRVLGQKNHYFSLFFTDMVRIYSLLNTTVSIYRKAKRDLYWTACIKGGLNMNHFGQPIPRERLNL